MTVLTAYRRPVVVTAMDWNEADHPRDKDGRFGTVGSAAVEAFKQRPTVWTSKASGIEYVANPLAQVPQEEKSAVREQADALEDAMVDENQQFFVTKSINPAKLKSLQSQVARNQVVDVHAKGTHSSDDNGELPLVIDGPNGLILIDGNHRSSAALLSGGEVKAQVFDFDAWQAAQEEKKPVPDKKRQERRRSAR